jgi:rsbT co-antagonist protein RsbR
LTQAKDAPPRSLHTGFQIGFNGPGVPTNIREANRVVRPFLILWVGEKPMSATATTQKGLSDLLSKYEATVISEWVKEQLSLHSRRGVPPRDSELRKECTEFVGLLRKALQNGTGADIEAPGWSGVRELLSDISRSRGIQGFSPSETAAFIFSLKKPVFSHLRQEFNGDGQALADQTWTINELFDKLGLFTTEVYQRAREEIISRQQQEMLELSTPVVKLWAAHDRYAR